MGHKLLVTLALAIACTMIAAGPVKAADKVPADPPASLGGLDEASGVGDEDKTAGEVPSVEAARRSACSQSTEALSKACSNQVKDDYWVAYAKCLNEADEGDRRECIAEAREARDEATALCRDQEDARDEVCELLGEAPYDPEIDPDDFVSPEEAVEHPNPYFPLIPGTVWIYNDGQEITEVTVTDETIEILGIECFVVKDIVRKGGDPIEDTDDWYAQDRAGNVWYFGELTRSFEDGVISSLDGSWKTGIEGGKPGVIMEASPRVGDAYRQEFFLGEVEDIAEVTSIRGDEDAPAASCDGRCVVTRELTAIEPGTESSKYYARGVGVILESFPDGEREELVKFTPGSQRLAELVGSSPQNNSASTANLRVGIPSLSQPFQSASTINFELQGASDLTAEVYDSAGRKVRALASGRYGAGNHTIEWDGADTSQRQVAAGVYFLRVQAGDEAMSRKLVIVR